MKPTCPECNAAVVWTGTCHTWPGGKRDDGTFMWMSCIGCDSAVEYYCSDEDCDWSYEHGLNPKNPRAERNQQYCPEWITGPLECSKYGFPTIVEGVKYYMDDDE